MITAHPKDEHEVAHESRTTVRPVAGPLPGHQSAMQENGHLVGVMIFVSHQSLQAIRVAKDNQKAQIMDHM